MNKKGVTLQGIITASFLSALIYFLFFASFGLGGGFKAAYQIGALAAKIPAWAWISVAVVYLISRAK